MSDVRLYLGDCLEVMPREIADGSVDLALWSGPYCVGKEYERYLTIGTWQKLMEAAIAQCERVLKDGGFLVVNCADILAFSDPHLGRIRHNVISRCLPISKADILPLQAQGLDKFQIAEALGCSEQTIDRRLKGNNARGGKKDDQTRVEPILPHILEAVAMTSLYLYDRRIWVKDPAWESCQWHTISYRAIDEFEYLLIFAKPGVITIDRQRLNRQEWSEWGSRGTWYIPSVRVNDVHPAMFPLELAERIVRLFSAQGDTVLDCFSGSGTTGVACVQTGRNFIGIEIEPKYYEIAKRRIEAAQAEMVQARMPV